MRERRAAPRMRMLKSGRIFIGSWGVPCAVRNMSETGACLEVQTTYGIPTVFDLAMSNDWRRACKVIWVSDTKLGVQFQ